MKGKKISHWLLAGGFLVICALCLLLFSRYTRSHLENVFLTPTFTDDLGWDIQDAGGPLTVDALFESHDTVRLTRTLDPAWEEAGLTYLELDGDQPAVLFLDGELLYASVPVHEEAEEVILPAEFPTLPGVGERARITLPPGYGGRELTLVTRNTSEKNGMPGIFLTSGTVEEEGAVTQANSLGMPAAAFGVLCLCLLGLFFYTLVAGRADWPTLLLALAAACQSLYWLGLFEQYFTFHFALNFPLAVLLPQLFFLSPLVFLISQMGSWRWPCAAVTGVGAAVSFSYLLLSRVWSVPYELYDGGLLFALGATLVFAALEVRRGNRAFGTFFRALGLLCGAYALGCLLYPPLGQYTATAVVCAADGIFSLLRPLLGTGLFLVCAYLSAHQTVRRTADDQTELELLTARSDLTAENLRVLQENSAALAKARHDMMGHLSTLLALGQEGEYPRMMSYLEELTEQTAALAPLRLTAHPAVNAILLQYAQRCREAGVRFTSQVDLPETLPIPDSDLSSLLTNLFSNALTAAGEVKGWVEVTMHVRGQYLFVECRNPYGGTLARDAESGLYLSRQGAGHGWGIKIMEDIARRYQGDLLIEAKDGVFQVRTALFMA